MNTNSMIKDQYFFTIIKLQEYQSFESKKRITIIKKEWHIFQSPSYRVKNQSCN